MIAAAGGFAFALKRPGSRVMLSGLLLRIPRFGEVSRMLGTSKFAATVSTLHDAGCEVYTTLAVAGESCGNAFMARAFARVAERVRKGQTITESLERETSMDPLLIQMAGVGEQSGDLG